MYVSLRKLDIGDSTGPPFQRLSHVAAPGNNVIGKKHHGGSLCVPSCQAYGIGRAGATAAFRGGRNSGKYRIVRSWPGSPFGLKSFALLVHRRRQMIHRKNLRLARDFDTYDWTFRLSQCTSLATSVRSLPPPSCSNVGHTRCQRWWCSTRGCTGNSEHRVLTTRGRVP